MPELLLELLSEEIPARMQERAAEQLAEALYELTQALGFGAAVERASVETFATPRRLSGVVRELPTRQPDIDEERRGPRADAPRAAVEGFARSLGLGLDALEVKETEKGAFYMARLHQKGRATAAVLAEKIPDLVWNFAWPKSMRWGEKSYLTWIRPLRGILCLFDGKVVRFNLTRGIGKAEIGKDLVVGGDPAHRLESSNITFGHRFLAPEPFEVTNFADYEAKLRRAFVLLRPQEREKVIRARSLRLAEGAGLRLSPDPSLIAENAGLTEWPVPLIGSFDEAFMTLPREVLRSAMRAHQKYFALEDENGKLSHHFIVVANLETKDGGRGVRAGNERVLRARLADAKFFWEQDRRKRLADRVDVLGGIMFHARLGTLGSKVQRLRRLAPLIAKSVPGADLKAVERAALLCKADLTTEMVGEFPELQGVMGRYYALEAGESRAIADALAEHYAPQGPNDACPTTPVSVALALADKIDTLIGFFGVGEKPTGSKDPFALRRAALGVIRLLIENSVRLPLRPVFAATHAAYGDRLPQPDPEAGVKASDIEVVYDELLAFFAERLKVHLKEQGVRHDLISAVFDRGEEDDLVRLLAKVAALDQFLKTDDGANLLIAYRRGANILKIEEKRDKASYDGMPDPRRFQQDEERRLFERLGAVDRAAARALEREEFEAAMAELAKLRPPVDAFFDRVTVNCENAELRRNRLYLLSQARAALDAVADFSKIEG